MAIKTYKLRLDFDLLRKLHANKVPGFFPADEVQQWLWDTHLAFNAGVDYLTTWLLRLNRGAGVCRARIGGIWGEWQPLTGHSKLLDARRRTKDDPTTSALIENTDLLRLFTDRGKSEMEAVELAECCRRIAEQLCPPSDERDNKPMQRDSLDLLINPSSEARGIRPGLKTFRWELIALTKKSDSFAEFTAGAEQAIRAAAGDSEKQLKRLRNAAVKALIAAGLDKRLFANWCMHSQGTKRRSRKIATDSSPTRPSDDEWRKARENFLRQAPRPGWLEDRVIRRAAERAASWDELFEKIEAFDELDSDGGRQRIQKLRGRAKKSKKQWHELKEAFIAEIIGDIDDYGKLLLAGMLPLPGLAAYQSDSSVTLGTLNLRDVGSEWKRSMWDMAGQRIRSHLGWVRRRAGERLLWEKIKRLFEQGGWIRTWRDGKKLKKSDIEFGDVVFERPSDSSDEFDQRPAYADRKWFKSLCEYETSDMLKHLERVSFSAGTAPKLTKRTIKGWVKVRTKWNERLTKDREKNRETSQDDLVAIVNTLRKRKPREFGDQRVFEWLAYPDRRWLWNGIPLGDDNDCGGDDRDCVSAFTTFNDQIVDKPESITFTRSHATTHPVWPFFGENSAVKYTLRRLPVDHTNEKTGNTHSEARLVLTLGQLLRREPDGSFTAVNQVAIPLKGYADFEESFDIANTPEPHNAEPKSGDAAGASKQKRKKPKEKPTGVTAKQELIFRDDLLGGEVRKGSLSGMKLSWNRAALEQAQNKSDKKGIPASHSGHRDPPLVPPTERIYAVFSCDAGKSPISPWLNAVGKTISQKKPRDGMTQVFRLDNSITRENGKQSAFFTPGNRRWPRDAVEHGLRVRGTDLGFRSSSVGGFWRLSFERPSAAVVWVVGHCIEDRRIVYAVLEEDRPNLISLPGDGEEIPEAERQLRERLRRLRTRLNLNNAILRITRLLSITTIERKVPRHDTATEYLVERSRRRRDGVPRPLGVKWVDAEPIRLDSDEIQANCRKAAIQLLTWEKTDSMRESLTDIGWKESLWEWLVAKDSCLKALVERIPRPSDNGTQSSQNASQVSRFVEAVHDHRVALARALCGQFDSRKQRRATSGLWFEFDRALLCEVSYGDKQHRHGKNKIFADGLLRQLRKPPVTKHADRKDDVNNLPFGVTHRGGLSMARLNFLDDVKNFVRKWSCRPRWPGDVRRLSQDEKFDRHDSEHIDHLREHRAKLVAHADVAQALGFEQDLRLGLWRFRDKKSGELLWHRPERKHFYRNDNDRLVKVPTPADETDCTVSHPTASYTPAHILVYEDLSRYKMSADRPKNENAGLARWSHRKILKFAQHIGGLFGMSVATVPAAYSSRFCSRCGAPGCRADRFNPAWIEMSWMQRILQSTDIRDAAIKRVAKRVHAQLTEDRAAFDHPESWLWFLSNRGTHFVCASRKGCNVHTTPLDADENAAANIGLWFIRGIDDFRTKVDSTGVVLKPLTFQCVTRFRQTSVGEEVSFWLPANESEREIPRPKRRRQAGVAPTENEDSLVDFDDLDPSGGGWLFRDPSGMAFEPNHWYKEEDFWTKVRRLAKAGIKATDDG